MKTHTHNDLVEVFFFLVVSFVICSIWYTSIKHTYQNGFDLEMKWTLKMVGISVYFVFIKNQENDLCGMIKTTAAAFISDKIIVFVYFDMMAFVWDKMSREKKIHTIRGCCWLHVYVMCNFDGIDLVEMRFGVFFVAATRSFSPIWNAHIWMYFNSDLISYSLVTFFFSFWFCFIIIITNILLPLLNALPPNH